MSENDYSQLVRNDNKHVCVGTIKSMKFYIAHRKSTRAWQDEA